MAKYANTERQFVIHPDNVTMFKRYAEVGAGAIQEMRQSRDEAIARGEQYWNSDHDAEMKETAIERTRIKAAQGWKFKTRG